MKRIIKVCLFLTAFLLFFVVFAGNSHAQSTDFHGDAPNTKDVVDQCLAGGGTPQQCVEAGAQYLRDKGYPDASAICGTELCFIVCSNGAVISVPIPSPTPTLTPPPTQECIPNSKFCSADLNQECVCNNEGTASTCTPCASGFCSTSTGVCPGPTSTPTVTKPPTITTTITVTPPRGTTGTPPVTTVTQPPGTTTTPVVTKPVSSPTPTPPFNTAMCKCDNIQYTAIDLGKTTSITAFGKVEGTDTQFATIPSFNFTFYAGTDTTATLVSSKTVAATQIPGGTNTKVQYKSTWDLLIPNNLDTKKVYRIQATPACSKKTAAIPQVNTVSTSNVLAAETKNVGFFEGIIQFFVNLFGGGKKQEVNNISSIQQEATIAPKQPNLQIGTFTPLIATIDKDANNCSFVRLQFAQ